MRRLALLAAIAVALPTRTAAAFAPDVAPAEDTSDPALAEAQSLYTEGLTHYETLDYDLAIDQWKRALGRLRDAKTETPEQAAGVAAARNAIVYNIARAQEKAFDQDHDVARLKKAKGLLEVYVGELAATETEEIAKANARIEELAARIEAAEKKAEKAAPPPKVEPRTDRAPQKPRGRGLVGGGAAMLVTGLGLVAGGVTAGVLMSGRAEDRLPELDELADEDARRDEIARGKRGDVMLIAFAVSGGALAIGGAAMLAVGAVRMKTSRASQRAAMPLLGPGFAGVALRGRF
jgi:hypothetical protein